MPLDCQSYMVADKNWKYIYAPGYPPVLFDLKKDPCELNDLGQNAGYKRYVNKCLKNSLPGHWYYRQRETWSGKT